MLQRRLYIVRQWHVCDVLCLQRIVTAIKQKLDTIIEYTPVTIGASNYVVKNMNRTSDVLSLGPETETDRRQFAVNYLATLRQIS